MRDIALFSFRELVRERFVHVLFLVSLAIFIFCFPLGALSFEEQARILFHFGFLVTHVTTIGVAIFLGSSRIIREIERQTSLIVLARPISRIQFFVGKWLGCVGVVFVLSFSLSMILFVLLNYFIGASVELIAFLKVATGVFLEGTILLTLAMSMSMIVRPSISFFAAIGIFLFGNWLPDLKFFAERSKEPLFIMGAEVLQWLSPQLYRLNWRSLYLAENGLPDSLELAGSSFHVMAWTALILVLGVAVFRRKDLV